mmetsp:Transcript_7283/g.20554  ORF Transcript_7283/g.20554 Transcript_7283/m.20554 type:complete len:834 (-) Transcript_7283:258-2759(-)|eukprot:CAMPEP_0117654776 /NCGR_PEP_ID=MMETSP0804-20121206/3927_1 /TAXON_ID=1074897 /ORGANISM="Tetraselmis astigmatica, Strain CCMP880" /LENGTH=833 /DNA_ID=CAMNT_0005461085 /DNA_START=339 /DNA_END=2840 /DNA_ORIENTATION=+
MVFSESRDAALFLEAEAVVAEAETLAQLWESGIISIEQAEESSMLLERLAEFVGEGISEELMDDDALSRLLDVTTKLSQISAYAESQQAMTKPTVQNNVKVLSHNGEALLQRKDSKDQGGAGLVQVITVKEGGRENFSTLAKIAATDENMDVSSVLQKSGEDSTLQHSTSVSVDWYSNHVFGDGSQEFSVATKSWQPLGDPGEGDEQPLEGQRGMSSVNALRKGGLDRVGDSSTQSETTSEQEELEREDDGDKLELMAMATAGEAEDGAKLLQQWRWWLRMQQSHEDSDNNDAGPDFGPNIRVSSRNSPSLANDQRNSPSLLSGHNRRGSDVSAVAERYSASKFARNFSAAHEFPTLPKPEDNGSSAASMPQQEAAQDERLGSFRDWSCPGHQKGTLQQDQLAVDSLFAASEPPAGRALSSPGTPEPTTPQQETNWQKRGSSSSLSSSASLEARQNSGGVTAIGATASASHPKSGGVAQAPASPCSKIGGLPDSEIARMLGIRTPPMISAMDGAKLIERLNADLNEAQPGMPGSSKEQRSMTQRMLHHHRGSMGGPGKSKGRARETGGGRGSLESFVQESRQWVDNLWRRQNMLMVANSHPFSRPNLFDSPMGKLRQSPGQMDPEMRQFRMSEASRKLLDGRGCQTFEERNRLLLQRRAEAVQRWKDPEDEELAECTWKPALNPSSLMIAGQRSRADLARWDMDRKGRIKKKQWEREREAEFEGVQECTFQPQINEKSRELAALRQAHQDAVVVTAAARPSKRAETIRAERELQQPSKAGKEGVQAGAQQSVVVQSTTTRKGKPHRPRKATAYPNVTEMVSRALLAMEQEQLL